MPDLKAPAANGSRPPCNGETRPSLPSYSEFIEGKSQLAGGSGFDPIYMPEFLFDFQRALVDWACRRGRAAIFADCGLGKTPMQLVWAENVVRHTNGRVLILTPIAVGIQTVAEGEKFGIECARSRGGTLPEARIVIANYESLHKFDPSDFSGVVCDESSILKHFSGATQKGVTRFMSKVKYRLLCTATAAPNDYTELGTSSEALGELGYSDMLSRFFRQNENHPVHRMDQIKKQNKGEHFAKLAYRVAQTISQWSLKAHAEIFFWRWVASWARACRKPSDLGFADGGFILPPLNEVVHMFKARTAPNGFLFTLPAIGLGAERDERRRTLAERIEAAVRLGTHDDPVVAWVQLNVEGDRLEREIPGAVQVSGADDDEAKEEKLMAFIRGEARVLVTKAKIAGFGLNFQRCAHVVTFATHSYEQHYQAIRRCWRFGQTRPVRVDVIATEGEMRIVDNMARKSAQAEEMFARMVEFMGQGMAVKRETKPYNRMEIPTWMRQNRSSAISTPSTAAIVSR